MNLVIDIGNSYQKIALFDKPTEPLFVDVYKIISLDIIQALFKKYKIKNTILSAVATYDKEIENFLYKNSKTITFSQFLKFPITIHYEEPQTLGSDRIANAVAAHFLYPKNPVLSIQIGSCIVADFVDENGNYSGGSISPGLDMRFRALHQFTSQLPQITRKEIDFFIGNSTENSILSGVMNGTISEINTMIQRYKSQYSNIVALLTGGDAKYLHKSLKKTIFASPNLVLIGLNKILEINLDEQNI